ncbi:MAG TPA: hypothetical protein PKY31_00790 [Spirochaetota bacterium]|nr:hypothetical protein [Spirochaetota bacterium]
MKTNVTIIGIEKDGKIVVIKFIDGKKYRLQHPGNRTYLAWQKEFFSVVEGMDMALFLDKAFEHCVIPEGHDFKPTVDDVKPKELEVWGRMLRRFLGGDLDTMVAAVGETSEGSGDPGVRAKRG